jgi:site-specific DNA-cytosine methylase
MRHASFFSGVGGLDLGFERAGIETVSVCEIDQYASAVLAERFPSAPNLGSITEVNAHDIPEADIWSGGFPCQDLSVAGKRAGFFRPSLRLPQQRNSDGDRGDGELADQTGVVGDGHGGERTRSGLAFTFLDLVEQRRPRWIVLENVPGLLSSNEGRDFARLLGEMEGLGYGVAWRTLDARYFGVAQRRRRVFIVGSLGTDRAASVLFECEGCERHPTPSQPQGEETTRELGGGAHVAGAITGRFGKGVNSTIDEPLIISGQAANPDGMRAPDGMARRVDDQPVMGGFTSTPAHGETYADTLAARDWKGGVSNQDMTRRGWLAIVRESNFGGYANDETDAAGTLRASGGDLGGGSENLAVAATLTSPTGGGRRDTLPLTVVADTTISFPSAYSRQPTHFNNVADPLTINAGPPAVFRKSARAQTNEDSETWVEGDIANTLNSFDVGDTRTTHAVVGGAVSEDPTLPAGLDSHRYRCCGNGVVAPVAEWIGRRIMHVEGRGEG